MNVTDGVLDTAKCSCDKIMDIDYDSSSWVLVGDRTWQFVDRSARNLEGTFQDATDRNDTSTVFQRVSVFSTSKVWIILIVIALLVAVALIIGALIAGFKKRKQMKEKEELKEKQKEQRRELAILRDELAEQLEMDPDFSQAVEEYRKSKLTRTSVQEAQTLIDTIKQRHEQGHHTNQTMANYTERQRILQSIQKSRREIVRKLKFNLEENAVHTFTPRSSRASRRSSRRPSRRPSAMKRQIRESAV